MMLGATLAFGEANPPDLVQRCQGNPKDAIQDKNPNILRGATWLRNILSAANLVRP